MAKYYLSGYTPPEGVNSASKVKEYQRSLGVKVDGIWGPDTDAAYRASQQAAQSQSGSRFNWGPDPSTPAAPAGDGGLFNQYYNSILSSLTVPTVTVDTPSRQEVSGMWKDILRPEVDSAIARRESAAREDMAELDADAVSRGMGSSTYVTSMKERQQEDAEEDIDELEARYGATLAERIYGTLSQYDQLRASAEQYNASARAAAQNLAANMASDWYGQYLSQQNAERMASLNAQLKSSASAKSSGSSAKSSSANKKSSSLSAGDYVEYVQNLTPGQQKLLFNSQGEYWSTRRDEIYSALGSALYSSLQKKYGQGG